MLPPRKHNIFVASASPVERQSHLRGVVPPFTSAKSYATGAGYTNALIPDQGPFISTSCTARSRRSEPARNLTLPSQMYDKARAFVESMLVGNIVGMDELEAKAVSLLA
jgi:hypothetical protein